jgi:hypothetical protein
MTFRRRLLLACAAAVAVAVALAAVLAYVVVRDTLRGQIDDSLRAATRPPSGAPAGGASAPVQGEVTSPAPGEAGDEIILQALREPVLFTQIYRGNGLPERPPPGGPGPLVSNADCGGSSPAPARRSSRSATTGGWGCVSTRPRSPAAARCWWGGWRRARRSSRSPS